jgi:VCBS repeat-containing protein
VTVSLAGGATISSGANGSSTLTVSGTQAQINAALASISYQGNADFTGSETLTVVSTDANGATDSDSVAITVSAVNDAPAVTSATTGTFAESTAGAVYTATRSDADSGDTVTWTLTGPDAALFTIDPVTGVVSLSAAQDFDTPGDANADGIYEISVRATDSGGQFDVRSVQLTLTQAPAVPATPPVPSIGTAPATPLPAAPVSPLPAPDFAPLGTPAADPRLGLPVDGGVAASNLAAAPAAAAQQGGAASGVPGILDLNALPPTAAGVPSTFALTRLSQDEAAAHLRTLEILPPETGGHRLFVYHGVPDMRLLVEGSAVLRVPTDAFAHTDPSAVVHLEARLANGFPLPGWLKFDGLRGVFSGTPPEGVEETLEVEVLARDTEGREARTQFTLEIDALRGGVSAAGLALGLDVDKEEAEKARLEAARQASEAKAAKAVTATAGVRPAKSGAASFSDQVSAAKTQRDPLLDRISPSDKAKPGARR